MNNRTVLSLIALAAAVGGLTAPRLAAADADDDKEPQAAGIEEITVTARRVKESMQDVPVAITAFSADTLQQEHISSNEDLLGKVPSLVVGPDGQQRL